MKVFFYGLFMDQDILIKRGLHPSNPQRGYLKDYSLRIEDRAFLIPSKNKRAYGMIMELNNKEIAILYSEKSVSDYVPEVVEVVTESNENIDVICYNLQFEVLSGTNKLYAQSLYELAKKLTFPKKYLREIEAYFIGR